MKRLVSVILTVMLIGTCFVLPVSAATRAFSDVLIARDVETLDNGDYVISELYAPSVQDRFTTTGRKTSTYYNSVGTKIWDVTVTGTFSYSYGVSSEATSASATVAIYDNKAVFKSKDAYTTGNTAVATGTVTYNLSVLSRTVKVSCDKYGTLS